MSRDRAPLLKSTTAHVKSSPRSAAHCRSRSDRAASRRRCTSSIGVSAVTPAFSSAVTSRALRSICALKRLHGSSPARFAAVNPVSIRLSADAWFCSASADVRMQSRAT